MINLKSAKDIQDSKIHKHKNTKEVMYSIVKLILSAKKKCITRGFIPKSVSSRVTDTCGAAKYKKKKAR